MAAKDAASKGSAGNKTAASAATDVRTRRRNATEPAQPAFNPFWGDDPDVWDRVNLAGRTLPGLCAVDVDLTRKVDSASASGADGANLRDKGYEAAKVKVTVRIWTAEHLGDWEDLLPTINPRRNTAARIPLPIFHPELEELGIRQVYVTGISGLVPTSPKGTRQATITCVEFAPPTRRNVTRTATPAPSLETRQDAFGAADAGNPKATPADTNAGPT